MACQVHRDDKGALYRVPAYEPPKTQKLPPKHKVPHIDVWWDRDAVKRDDELLMLRQENGTEQADVITLSLGQAFDMLHAISEAIKDI
jgi:hypothetical protein